VPVDADAPPLAAVVAATPLPELADAAQSSRGAASAGRPIGHKVARTPRRAPRAEDGDKRLSQPGQRAESNAVSGEAPPVPDELELLRRAQALVSSAPAQALEHLAAHALHHPEGQFAEEREALRLEVLARLLRHLELEPRARAFLARYPRSLHRARVQRLLDLARAAD
jgi:hypothetical protein